MDTIADYLDVMGPCLASKVAEWLVTDQKITPEAARKRLSRVAAPIRSFPVPLFPKGARFLYLESQRGSEEFWLALYRDLRSTGSIYGIALDGLAARQGSVRYDDFDVVSGATTVPVKKQVTVKTVVTRLCQAGLLTEEWVGGGRAITIKPYEIFVPNTDGMKARNSVELVILDGLREWARKIGAASYNQIRIRGEAEHKAVGQFMFDLAGPSYLLPLRRGRGNQPGFLVADVFSEGTLNENHIRYFVRKAQALHVTLTGATVMPILVADSFTGAALTAGHAAGIILATPEILFGRAVGEAIHTLIKTLSRAAVYASADKPDRLVALVESLKDIEGRAGNLRGPLFELIAAYLARRDAVSIDMGVIARDKDGRSADIDVLKFTSQHSSCVAIECKGKEPNGIVMVKEVEEWLKKVPIIQYHLRSQSHLREADLSFELWTTGSFSPDAVLLLEAEAKKRKKMPIVWRDGRAVLELSTVHKEKAISDTLKQHFLMHPLSKVD
ncbi:hypothetical protein [Pseudomonas thivervalensis]|uniref:hypothetical protein n=1 Tax=Pseudomonas thivervalensis TaxID=86265 RepID=UPI00069DD9E9|nr:hypothetical protein [Pseudomonas thivervalensis]